MILLKNTIINSYFLALFVFMSGCQTPDNSRSQEQKQEIELLNPPIQLFSMNGDFAPCFSGEFVYSIQKYISMLSSRSHQTEQLMADDIGVILADSELQVFSIRQDNSLPIDHFIFSRPDGKFKEIRRHAPRYRLPKELRPKIIALESGNLVDGGSFVRISAQLAHLFYILYPEFEKNKDKVKAFQNENLGRFLFLLEKTPHTPEMAGAYQFRIFRGYTKMPFCGYIYNVDAQKKIAVLKDVSCFAHSLQ